MFENIRTGVFIIYNSLLFGFNPYLKDPWNMLDFVIVITGIISEFSSGANLKSLRALRILRPLRTFNKIKSLKIMIVSIFSSFYLLLDLIILMIFY